MDLNAQTANASERGCNLTKNETYIRRQQHKTIKHQDIKQKTTTTEVSTWNDQ